jgi:UDP-glucuronate 4-epimerase
VVKAGESRVVVTGVAGFIGFHLARRLLAEGVAVLGLDNLNDYYDPSLKRARLARLAPLDGFTLETVDIADHARILSLFGAFGPTGIVHLAAQAGVRYSLDNPRAYVGSNLDGFLAVLEACRRVPVRHLVYASSSSVYGANAKLPFSEGDRTDRPVSLYAATKRANELMAYSYAHLFGIPATGLRFFTVYGPWGRPDMAYYKFTQAICAGREIELYNGGRMRRDFTYIDDAVEAVMRLLARPPRPGEADPAPHAIYNIGSNAPVELERFVEIIGEKAGRPVRKIYRPMQPGDVPTTFADVGALAAATGYRPATTLDEGIGRFVAWYRGSQQEGSAPGEGVVRPGEAASPAG